jgi:phosphoheptose isomerase
MSQRSHWRRVRAGSPALSRFESLEPRRLLSVSPVGAEFRANSTTASFQISPAVAADADGDFVVAWQSLGQDGDGYGVFAQRYDAAGLPQGSEFPVNTFTTGLQGSPAVAMDANGNFVVAWQSNGQDGDALGVHARRFDAAGNALSGELLVNTHTTSSQSAPVIAMDSDGDFVVAWQSDLQDGSDLGVYAQRYDSAGATQGGEFPVNTTTSLAQSDASVAMDAAGNFAVTWASTDQDGSAGGVYARRFDAAGAPQGAEFLVNTFTTNEQRDPAIALDSDGDFVVAWRSFGQDGSGDGIFAQRYSAAGVSQGSEFQVNTYTTLRQTRPQAAIDSAGGFTITWQSFEQDGSLEGIYAQQYLATGAADGAETLVNSFTTSTQSAPAVAMDSDGNFVVAWSSYAQDGDAFGIYAQRFALVDSTAPVISSSTLEFDAGQAVSLTFDEPLNPATVTATDLSALNLDDASTPVADAVILTAGDTVATWVFNTPGTFISNGDYTFTLPAGAVSDVAGNPLGAQFDLTGAGVFFLSGDANRDRSVTSDDFNLLATNFGLSGKTFAQGNFDYDALGLVNSDDFNLLATNFGISVGPASFGSHRIGGTGKRMLDSMRDDLLA